MRKLWVIVLLGVILLQSGIKTAIVAHFYANQDFISATLCENRNVPLSSCNGKCYLKKKIVQQQRTEAQLPAAVREQSEVIFFYCANNRIEVSLFAPVIEKRFPFFGQTQVLDSPVNSIFHPPPFYI